MPSTDSRVDCTLGGMAFMASVHAQLPVYWDVPGSRVTRLRLIGDPGSPFVNAFYCHGALDGKPVDVQRPTGRSPGLFGARRTTR